MRPKVSVLIPCFNSRNFIEETVQSVLDQNYDNFQILIQDDCSSDGTWEFLQEKFGNDPVITLFQNEQNLGMCANWNRLFERATGEYWLKLDADDIIYPEFLNLTVERAIKSNADFVGSSYSFYDNSTKEKSKVWIHEHLDDGELPDTLKQIFINYPLHLCFTLLKAEFVKNLSPDNRYFMETEVGDAEFQIRAALTPGFTAEFIRERLGLYRIHGTNSSLTPLKQSKSFIYDVIGFHHESLKSKLAKSYRKKLQGYLFNYVKSILLLREPLDLKLLFTIFNFYRKAF